MKRTWSSAAATRLALRLRVGAVVLGLFGLAGACASADAGEVRIQRVDTTEVPIPNDATDDVAPVSVDDPEPEFSVSISDVDCSVEALGDDEESTFAVAHYVIDGQLGDVCYGEQHDLLLSAWDDLATITPPAQLNDLVLFAGFSANQDGDEETLAFVNAVDYDDATFQMSINLEAYEADPEVALLTIAHEFAHVFTQSLTQIDFSDEAWENCETYQSSEGCFLHDSLIATWVDTFWSHEALATLSGDPSLASGEALCALDASYFGPYAASDPEEDFAEAFSAYVFDVPADTPAQQLKLDWIGAQPGLNEFRDRARSAGLTPLSNVFDTCGS